MMDTTLLDPAVPLGNDEDMTGFLREIRQIPRLTPEQERSLAQRCAAGDEEAVRAMVGANLRLVVSVAREYAGRGIPMLDLVQEGSIGLLAAARKFDYTLEYRFSTYATKWIHQGIRRYLENQGQMIRVPRYTAERLQKIQRAKGELLQMGKTAQVEEIAEITGISADKVEQYIGLEPEICSLDAPAGEDGTLQHLLEDLQAPQPHEELVRRELKNTMDALLGMLPQRQQRVLRLRFGMDDGVCHSLEKIGAMLGVSKERARQIEHQAMDKLQKLGASLGLEDFLE